MSLQRRLEDLERHRLRSRSPGGSPEARRHMKEHLDRIAELRRGGATVENNAELAAVLAALERRRAADRGEGRS